ncbi:MAG: hypothetical protein O2877_02790 [bacterium]|nr:hypothetical protein [bacterium]
MSNIPSILNTSESEQIDLVAAYLRSGLTQKSFCKWRGIEISVFKGWLSRYKECANNTRKTKDRPLPPAVDAPSSLFKVLKVQEEESPSVAAAVEPVSPAAPRVSTLRIEKSIEKNLFSIKVPKGFDQETLRNILSVMQTLPS